MYRTKVKYTAMSLKALSVGTDKAFIIQDKKPPAMQVECINFSKSIWRKNRQKSLLDIQ